MHSERFRSRALVIKKPRIVEDEKTKLSVLSLNLPSFFFFFVFLRLHCESENSISSCLRNLAEVTVADEGEHSTTFQEIGEACNWEEQGVAEVLVHDFADLMLIGDDSW